MTHRLEIAGLTCARGDRPLFSDLSLEVVSGELLHVVGGNGAGKTTLLRTICGLSRPAAGEIRWQGQAIDSLGDDYRRDVTYVGHLDGIQGELTPVENLVALACLARAAGADAGSSDPTASRVADAIERLELGSLIAFPAKLLSQGQKRRLALARLLLLSRPLWILDEPYTALDARSCGLVNRLLAEHVARGGIALVSSHQRLELPAAKIARVDLETLRAGLPAAPRETPAAARASARGARA